MADWKREKPHSAPLTDASSAAERAWRQLDTLDAALARGNRVLRELDDDLLNVIDSVEIAVLLVDLHSRVRRMTPRASALLGLAAGDRGRPLAELHPRLPLEDIATAISEVIGGRALVEREVEDGNGRWYRIQIRPYRHADRRIGGAVLAFIDITSLRATIDSARASRDYVASIIESVPNPLAVLDSVGRVCLANRAMCDLIATARVKLIGRELFVPPAWSATSEICAQVAGVHATGVPVDDFEIRFYASSEVRILSCNARAITSGDARLVLVGMSDITARRRAEEDRQRLADAKQAARDAADRQNDAFLNAVSHELRTPLNAILLWSQVLRHCEPGDPRYARGIETIERSLAAEAALIDDLIELATARSNANALMIIPESFDAVPVVIQATEALAAIAAEKRITLRVDAAALRVVADPRRLQQIVSKLLANAIKFTPAGGAIRVSLAAHDGWGRLAVRDSGRGISREFLARVFEPFAREDTSLTRAHAGLGIGLALVRHLVERQHGRIHATSDGEGTGATFIVELPLAA